VPWNVIVSEASDGERATNGTFCDPYVPSMSPRAELRVRIPTVLKITVMVKVCPWNLPVQVARVNFGGSTVSALSLGEGGARDLPLTGIPAMVPENGCRGTGAAPLVPGAECHVIVAVPEPVGNEGEAQPANAAAANASSPPKHDVRTTRRAIGAVRIRCRVSTAG
jgi:hypothetical protein